MRKNIITLSLLLTMLAVFLPFADTTFPAVHAAEADSVTEDSEPADDKIDDGWKNVPVWIIDQPQSVAVTEGGNTTFTVRATGEELNYQWQLSDDEGATWHDSVTTTPTYTMTATREKDRRLVRCVVTDANGYSVVSQKARLTVVTEAQLNVNMDDFEIVGDTLVAYHGSAEEVYIPDGVKKIDISDNNKAETVKSIIIPASVVSIGPFAYGVYQNYNEWGIECTVRDYVPHLANITVDKNNPVYASKDGVLFNKTMTKLLYCPPQKKGDYVVPDTVTYIEWNAFGHSKLTSVTMPDSVTEIGEYAFANSGPTRIKLSASLKSIPSFAFSLSCATRLTIPASVSEIDHNAFGWEDSCSYYFEVDSDNPYYAAKDGVLFNKDMTVLDVCMLPLSEEEICDAYYAIPDTVTTIGGTTTDLGFGWSRLHNIAIPRSVTTIKDGGFGSCHSEDWVTDIYYEGSKEEWEKIQIEETSEARSSGNYCLTEATIHYNFEGLSEKTNIVMMDSFQKRIASSAVNDEQDMTEPMMETIPETAEADEAVRVDLAEIVPEVAPQPADLPSEVKEAAGSGRQNEMWQFGEAFQALDDSTAIAAEFDLPDSLAEMFDIPEIPEIPEVPEIPEMHEEPALTAESYVPSVWSNALCMNLAIWGIALSLTCTVVTKRRRRFLAAKPALA